MAKLQVYQYIFLAILIIILPKCISCLQIVAVLPLNHTDRPTSSWERGLEILPGAQVAIEFINQNLSQNNRFELLLLDSGTCRNEFKGKALIDFINLTLYRAPNLIGFVGLFCSSSEKLLSNLAFHIYDNITVVSSSASYTRNRQSLASSSYYHILQSGNVFVDVFSSLATHVGWSRVSVVTESSDEYFFSVAEALYNSSTATNAYNSVPFIQLHGSQPLTLFHELRRYNSKTIFLSTSIAVSIEVLCAAKEKGFTWPDYVWIVHSTTFADFDGAKHAAMCNIHEALEGTILLEHRLKAMNDTLHVGYQYSDYTRKYKEMLADLSTKINVTLQPNVYANLLHDSVWAFALALHSKTGSGEFHLPNHFKNISFNGAIGNVQFTSTLETRTGVDIFQVRNSNPVHEGYYHPTWQNITFIGSWINKSLPSNGHKIVTDRSSLLYTSILSVVIIMCVILVTLILILYVYYYKEPEIKSTSVMLSLLMFISCYVFLFYLILAIIYTRSLVPSTSPFNICTALAWLSISGIPLPLILATLLVKMLRVFRIFTLYGKIGKMCSDTALLIYVLLLISPCFLILTFWSAADPYTARTIVTEHPGFTQVEQRCFSRYLLVWIGLILVNIITLIVVLLTVAIKTRKIRQAHFKDTKKVNAFLFILLLVIFITLSYWMIFRTIGAKKGYSDITLHIAHIIIVVSCQGFLFVPKVLPPLQRSLSKQFRLKSLSSPTSLKTNSTTISLTTNQIKSVETKILGQT